LPQITTITSETLQAEIRRLLPSQQGFGVDLEASNVITPVIDLTAASEGSVLPANLQTAYSLGNIINDEVINGATSTAINTTGFFKYNITSTLLTPTSGISVENFVRVTTGLSTKILHRHTNRLGSTGFQSMGTVLYEGVVFLNAGESVTITASTRGAVNLTAVPIASINGTLTNPSGFTFE
jgi:hypothetical protein